MAPQAAAEGPSFFKQVEVTSHLEKPISQLENSMPHLVRRGLVLEFQKVGPAAAPGTPLLLLLQYCFPPSFKFLFK